MATEPEEGNRPRLNWPEHDLVPASRRDARQPEPPEPEPEPPEPEEPPSASVLFTVASRLEGLKTSLATMGSRIDTLARSEEQFREFTTARLGEHTQQIADSMRDISTELGERGRALDASLAERADAEEKSLAKLQEGVDEAARSARETTEALDTLRKRSEEVAEALEVLTGQVQAVAEDVPSLRAELIDFISRTDTRDEELAAELRTLVDEVKVLRRRLPVRSATAAAPRRVRRPEPEPIDEDDFIVEEPAPAPTPRRRASRTRGK